jgi:hypothetical protein
MSQLNSLAIDSPHKSSSSHPFRKAAALLLVSIGTSPALVAAQIQQRAQNPVSTTTMASNTIPSLPGSNTATPDSYKMEISDKAPNPADLAPNKPYYYKLKGDNQVYGCVNMVRGNFHRISCAPASADIQAQAR